MGSEKKRSVKAQWESTVGDIKVRVLVQIDAPSNFHPNPSLTHVAQRTLAGAVDAWDGTEKRQ